LIIQWRTHELVARICVRQSSQYDIKKKYFNTKYTQCTHTESATSILPA